jgi:hypothetical protein
MFSEYIAYAKAQGKVPFCSGYNDEEDASNKVQTLLEDLYEVYSASLKIPRCIEYGGS